MEPSQLDSVAAILGHHFVDQGLLRTALTHRSYANENARLGGSNNERLEFLGDAVLGLVVSKLLCDAFPSASEGELTRRRADIVCESTLATIAEELQLGQSLLLGRGEERSGGRQKPRLLACVLEACVGAVFVDGGAAATFAVVPRWLEARIRAGSVGERDFKSRLQQLVQSQRSGTLSYRLLGHEGPEHARVFRIQLNLGDQNLAEGQGHSKAEAEQSAARSALVHLQEDAGRSTQTTVVSEVSANPTGEGASDVDDLSPDDPNS